MTNKEKLQRVRTYANQLRKMTNQWVITEVEETIYRNIQSMELEGDHIVMGFSREIINEAKENRYDTIDKLIKAEENTK